MTKLFDPEKDFSHDFASTLGCIMAGEVKIDNLEIHEALGHTTGLANYCSLVGHYTELYRENLQDHMDFYPVDFIEGCAGYLNRCQNADELIHPHELVKKLLVNGASGF